MPFGRRFRDAFMRRDPRESEPHRTVLARPPAPIESVKSERGRLVGPPQATPGIRRISRLASTAVLDRFPNDPRL